MTDNSIMQTGQAFFSNKSNHLAYQNINNQQYIKFTDKNLPPLDSLPMNKSMFGKLLQN